MGEIGSAGTTKFMTKRQNDILKCRIMPGQVRRTFWSKITFCLKYSMEGVVLMALMIDIEIAPVKVHQGHVVRSLSFIPLLIDGTSNNVPK